MILLMHLLQRIASVLQSCSCSLAGCQARSATHPTRVRSARHRAVISQRNECDAEDSVPSPYVI